MEATQAELILSNTSNVNWLIYEYLPSAYYVPKTYEDFFKFLFCFDFWFLSVCSLSIYMYTYTNMYSFSLNNCHLRKYAMQGLAFYS